MKLIKCLALMSAVSFLTACPIGPPPTRSSIPSAVRDKVIDHRAKQLGDLADKYDCSIGLITAAGCTVDLTKAKLFRNELLYESLQLVDANYNDFENDLFVKRASSNVLMDVTELGLSAATGITNGERVKNILAISATAFKGGRRSIDLNLFREQTTQVIVLKMRAARARVRQRVAQGVALDVSQYSLASGLDDLMDYINAGSINSALLELTQDTGADAKNAREAAADLKITPFLNEAEVAKIASISDAREKVRENLFSTDPATRAKGEKQIKVVLTDLYTADEIAKAITPTEMFNLLQQKIIAARRNSDAELMDKIQKALNKALAVQ
ncbi:MAG: hypothetical protein ACJ74W_21030 [Pyrinomonadaceae bacterium]